MKGEVLVNLGLGAKERWNDANDAIMETEYKKGSVKGYDTGRGEGVRSFDAVTTCRVFTFFK